PSLPPNESRVAGQASPPASASTATPPPTTPKLSGLADLPNRILIGGAYHFDKALEGISRFAGLQSFAEFLRRRTDKQAAALRRPCRPPDPALHPSLRRHRRTYWRRAQERPPPRRLAHHPRGRRLRRQSRGQCRRHPSRQILERPKTGVHRRRCRQRHPFRRP